MSTSKNIIVGLDGTWNEPEKRADGSVTGTNVVKFLSALMKRDQLQHYESGAGTRAWEALPGGIYGYGLDKRILGAYRFLRRAISEAQKKNQQPKVFIIGFSRGAYAARRLCGLLAHSGIPVKAKDIEHGWEMYLNRDKKSAKALKSDQRFYDVEIEAVIVWDTVKATNDPDYNDKLLSSNVRAGYHAIAVDEVRKFFPVLRWLKDSRVKEVFFPGSHSDIGGGCLEQDLSDVTLAWAIQIAAKHGLRFKKSYIEKHVKPSLPGHIHDCFTGIWIPYGKHHRAITANCAVHQAVASQMKKDVAYSPANLPSKPTFVKS